MDRRRARAERWLEMAAVRRKARERHPVLRIGDCKCADRGQEEEVEAEHRGDRGDPSFHESPARRDNQDRQQVREGDGRAVYRQDRSVNVREGGDSGQGAVRAAIRGIFLSGALLSTPRF